MKFLIDLMTHGVDYERFRRVYFSEPFNLELVSAIDLLRCSIARDRRQISHRGTHAADYIDKRRDVPA